MIISENNFREENVECTLVKLKNVFEKLDISLHEFWTCNENIYSVHIKIENTNIISNGKGVIKTDALVSAYAEMCERLQTKLHFRLTDVTSINDLDYLDNTVIKNLMISNFELWTDKLDMNISAKENVIQLYNDKKETLGKTLSYHSFSGNGDFINLPTRIADYFYGSNGMSAGNTINEAIAHAFVEIAERHTMHCVLKDDHNYLFEDISNVVRNEYNSINEKIKFLESFELECRVLDLSYIAGLPTIGLLSYRKRNSEYFFNIGSSPSIRVAIERAITEFLQGRDLNDINDMSRFRDMDVLYDHYNNRNIASIFRRNVGDYPISIIYNRKIVSELNPVWSNNVVDVDSMIEFYEQIFSKAHNKEIYIKDFTCIGFPTVQVVIPGISEIGNLNVNSDLLMSLERVEVVKKYFELIKEPVINYGIVDDLIQFFKSVNRKKQLLFLDVFRIPIIPDKINMMDLVTLDYILAVLNIMRGDTISASKYLNNYLDFLNEKFLDSRNEIMLYFQSLVMIINLHNSKVSKDRIYYTILEISYSTKIAQICFDDFYDNKISSLLPQISCPECKKCEYSYSCNYKEEKNILNIITKNNMSKTWFAHV